MLIIAKGVSSAGCESFIASSIPAIEAAISTPPEIPTAGCSGAIFVPSSFPTFAKIVRPRRRKVVSPTPIGRYVGCMNKIGRYGSLDARRRIHSLNTLTDELHLNSPFLRNTLVLTGTLSHLTMEFAQVQVG